MRKQKTKKATSLLEVIVVLAIISMTIVSSISLVARTRVQIKNNEITDQINGQVVKALEILKSPSDILVSNDANLTGAGPYFFTLSNPAPNKYLLQYQFQGATFPVITSEQSATGATNPNTNLPGCDNSSIFFVTGVLNFNYCQQVRIVPLTNIKTNQIYYQINVTLVYKNFINQNVYQTLSTYRYDNFKKSV